MFDLTAMYVSVACSLAENAQRQYENEAILKLPVEFQAKARHYLEERREKLRLERREKDMHDQLCASIEKAGKNARPRDNQGFW